MKHEWNEALAAYDRELGLLQALRDEYVAYIRERLRAAKGAVVAEYEGRATIDLGGDDDSDAGAEIVLVGEREEAALQVQVWSSAESGGEPGKLLWALLMNRVLSPDYDDASRVHRAAREAASAVVTEPVDQAPTTFADGFVVIRWGHLDLGDPDLGPKLARVFRSLLPAMEAAADAVLALRGASPTAWALRMLKGLRTDGSFEKAGAIEVKVAQWKPGPWVSARVNPEDWCWFTVARDGRLGLHWENKVDPVARKTAVMADLSSYAPWREQRWDGVVLLTSEEIERLHRDGADGILRERVLEAWRKYRGACVSSPTS